MSLSKDLKAFMKLNITDKKRFIEYGKEVDRIAKARQNGGVYIHSEAGTQIIHICKAG